MIRRRDPVMLVVVIAANLAVLRVPDHAPDARVAATNRQGFSGDRAFILEVAARRNVPPRAQRGEARDRRSHRGGLRAASYQPEIQRGSSARRSHRAAASSGTSSPCAVAARAKGSADTAHYDSVRFRCGGGDGAGVAAMLKIAELIARETAAGDVACLFADAEETGLRGAVLFADAHPLMRRVAFVLNMEARGVTERPA